MIIFMLILFADSFAFIDYFAISIDYLRLLYAIDFIDAFRYAIFHLLAIDICYIIAIYALICWYYIYAIIIDVIFDITITYMILLHYIRLIDILLYWYISYLFHFH